jgi:nucleoside-triphosphatase THEP1
MKLAAIRYGADEGATVDDLLVEVATRLKARQVRICGAIQYNKNDGDRRCDGMELEDLATGRRTLICDAIPAAIASCRIDETALAQAIDWADAGLVAGTELLIINKFGKREASGHGFMPVMQHAIDRNVAVIAAVGDRNAKAWHAAFGNGAAILPPDHEIVLDWCLNNVAVQGARRRASDGLEV